MLLDQRLINTPLGTLTALASLNGLVYLSFQEEALFLTKHLQKNPINPTPENENTEIKQEERNAPIKHGLKKTSTILEMTEHWIQNYFAQNFSDLKTPSLDLWGSPFEIRVWQHLLTVSCCATQSYGEVAHNVEKPLAARAVGRCVGNNPIALIVPCHRIMGKNGKLTGFRSGLDRKQWLLKHENLG